MPAKGGGSKFPSRKLDSMCAKHSKHHYCTSCSLLHGSLLWPPSATIRIIHMSISVSLASVPTLRYLVPRCALSAHPFAYQRYVHTRGEKIQPRKWPFFPRNCSQAPSKPSTSSNARATSTHGNTPEHAYAPQLTHLCSPPIPHCP